MYKQWIIVYFSCTLIACAASESKPDAGSEEPARSVSDCISQGSIRDYTVLNEANLIVTAAAKRSYHVALVRRAFGLRTNWGIGFSSTTSRICAGFSEIVVDDGFGPEKIRIASIRRLTPEEEEDLLIRFGKIEPKNKQPRQPEEVEEAEVEELD